MEQIIMMLYDYSWKLIFWSKQKWTQSMDIVENNCTINTYIKDETEQVTWKTNNIQINNKTMRILIGWKKSENEGENEMTKTAQTTKNINNNMKDT